MTVAFYRFSDETVIYTFWPDSFRKMPDPEILSADGRESDISPWLMPYQTAAKSFLGIVNAVFQLRDRRRNAAAGFHVNAADYHVAWSLLMSEQPFPSGRYDAFVMLRHDMIDHRKMRTVVKNEPFLAVVYVEIIHHNVLSADESVTESLDRAVVHGVIVVLIAGQHQADRMAWIRLQFLSEDSVAHIVIEAELTVPDIHPPNILQIHRALYRIHLFPVKMYSEFKIRDRKHRNAETPRAGIPFGSRQDRPRTGCGIMLFRRQPVGEQYRVVVFQPAEPRRAENL